MKYEEERKKAVGYCGEYCHKCDWYAGRIKQPADQLLRLMKTHPELRGWIMEKADVDNFVAGLQWLSESGFCAYSCKSGSGWKDCPVRKCCENRALSFCFECGEFPCKTWGKWPFPEEKVQTLREIQRVGVAEWVKKQWE